MNKFETILNWSLPKELEGFSRQLEETLEQNGELPTEFTQKMLEDNSNILYYVNQLLHHVMEYEAMDTAIAASIAELKERQDRYKKRITSVKDFLKMIMDKYALKRLDCPNGSVTKVIKQKNKLKILDEKYLLMENPEYFCYPEPIINKTALKEALLTGKEITGVDLVDTDYIQIRR